MRKASKHCRLIFSGSNQGRRLVINIGGAKIWVTNIGGQKFFLKIYLKVPFNSLKNSDDLFFSHQQFFS